MRPITVNSSHAHSVVLGSQMNLKKYPKRESLSAGLLHNITNNQNYPSARPKRTQQHSTAQHNTAQRSTAYVYLYSRACVYISDYPMIWNVNGVWNCYSRLWFPHTPPKVGKYPAPPPFNWQIVNHPFNWQIVKYHTRWHLKSTLLAPCNNQTPSSVTSRGRRNGVGL